MIVQDIVTLLEEWTPLEYAEDFDNVGLLVGEKETEVSGILVTLDCLETVVEEAIEKKCNLIVSFHPIVFSGLKKITGKTYVERVVMKALKNDIAIFSMHTALDNSFFGVNAMISERLNLSDKKILVPKRGNILKLVTYVPRDDANELRKKLFEAGAGNIGNYSNCSFNLNGTGTFQGEENSNPVKGERGKIHYEKETQLNLTFPEHLEQTILKSLLKNHPYEEVAYEITRLQNENQHLGMGMIGKLPEPISEQEFFQQMKEKFQLKIIRHSKLLGRKVQNIAVLGGSGAFAISAAKRQKADIFITADLKYHDFFKAEKSILLADIGHYESEQFTKNGIHTFLTKKIRNFAPAFAESKVIIAETNTNPIHYF